jgi:hypothetical protein
MRLESKVTKNKPIIFVRSVCLSTCRFNNLKTSVLIFFNFDMEERLLLKFVSTFKLTIGNLHEDTHVFLRAEVIL